LGVGPLAGHPTRTLGQKTRFRRNGVNDESRGWVRGKIRSIWGRLYRWVEGEYISPKNEPGSPLVFLMGHWERPMITNFAIRLGEFWLEHWKWIIPTGIMLAAVIVNALKH
jgi:hypothetical protein